eukprot:363664-Chlamydomonas_euryale.AAC.21
MALAFLRRPNLGCIKHSGHTGVEKRWRAPAGNAAAAALTLSTAAVASYRKERNGWRAGR